MADDISDKFHILTEALKNALDRNDLAAVFVYVAISTSDSLISHLVGCMIVLKDGRRNLARQ